jgi:cob(I)alamin adenosyltransferase
MRTKFYTKMGDKGKTKLGSRTLTKDHQLFDFLGACDQLNSWLGVVASEMNKKKTKLNRLGGKKAVMEIQNMLFICMAEVAGTYFGSKKSRIRITLAHLDFLEQIVAKIDAGLPPLKHFVIPGGVLAAAKLDYARTLARNVERMAVALGRKRKLSPMLLMFLNRLSSALFAMARYENRLGSYSEQAPRY